MKKYLLICLTLVLISITYATPYVKDHNQCPTTYMSQNCLGGQNACGYTGSILYCQTPATINSSIPNTNATTSSSSYNATLGGGYVLDCLPASTTCLPWICQRDASCYSVNRQTTCINGTTTYACGTCISGYNYCDGSYTDGDGCEITTGSTSYPSETGAVYNSTCGPTCSSGRLDCNGNLGSAIDGCEIVNGGACTIGGLSGTYSGCSGGSGNCVVPKSNFQTGTQTNYSSTDNLLWGKQYGIGNLINFSNLNNQTFIVNNSGCIIFPDNTAQCTRAVSGNGTFVYSEIFNQYLNTTNSVGFYNITKSENYFCTQVNAITDASCVTAGGSYTFTGTWTGGLGYCGIPDKSSSGAKLYDEDTITSSCGCADSGYSYINYTKPTTGKAATWTIYYGNCSYVNTESTMNYNIPSACYNSNPTILQLRLYSNLTSTEGREECYNGTTWQTLGNGTGTLRHVYAEEQIYWTYELPTEVTASDQKLLKSSNVEFNDITINTGHAGDLYFNKQVEFEMVDPQQEAIWSNNTWEIVSMFGTEPVFGTFSTGAWAYQVNPIRTANKTHPTMGQSGFPWFMMYTEGIDISPTTWNLPALTIGNRYLNLTNEWYIGLQNGTGDLIIGDGSLTNSSSWGLKLAHHSPFNTSFLGTVNIEDSLYVNGSQACTAANGLCEDEDNDSMYLPINGSINMTGGLKTPNITMSGLTIYENSTDIIFRHTTKNITFWDQSHPYFRLKQDDAVYTDIRLISTNVTITGSMNFTSTTECIYKFGCMECPIVGGGYNTTC